MKTQFTFLITFGILSMVSCNTNLEKSKGYEDTSLPIDKRVEDLMSRMTLEEKIAQTTSFTNHEKLYDASGNFIESELKEFVKNGVGTIRCDRLPGISTKTHAELINKIQKFIIENNRFGIPTLVYGEALHGAMANDATVFPSAIGLGSTWDTELIERIYSIAGRENRIRGINVAFTPVLDLGRDPRYGRIGETYGEDPYLVARMGVACIKGLQGQSYKIDENHVIATAKHFAVHSQPIGGLWCAPADISERTIREQFLYPFEVAVKEAKVGCVMATYNEINGIPINADQKLLTGILRHEWGFDGFVVSDLTSVEQLFNTQFVASDREEAAKLAIMAGVDMENARDIHCYRTLAEQFKNGLIPESVLDTAVTRILKAKFRLGLFENPYADPILAERNTNTTADKELALEAAHKSMVLLKNEGGMLPLDSNKIKNLAVIGPNAAELHFGAYAVEPRIGINVLDGIQNFAKGKFNIHYAEGCKITLNPGSFWENENPQLNTVESDAKLIREAVKIAGKCDAILLVIGENESTCRESWGEDNHRGDREDLNLLGRQDELVKAMLETGKPVVVLLLNERPLSVNYVAENVPAILEGWYLGQETGTAVADVIFGKVNPSGKLPVTFPKHVGQIPVYYNKKNTSVKNYLFLENTPLFPFGHGLSYTKFEYKNLNISPETISADKTAKATVEISNVGKMKGDEIVQMYIRDNISSVTRPMMELKGFERITLEPGQTKTVSFEITPEKLQFYDINMNRIVEPGEFDIMVGSSSVSYLKASLTVN